MNLETLSAVLAKELAFFDIFLSAQALLNAIFDETLIGDMKVQDLLSLARSPKFWLTQRKIGTGREMVCTLCVQFR